VVPRAASASARIAVDGRKAKLDVGRSKVRNSVLVMRVQPQARRPNVLVLLRVTKSVNQNADASIARNIPPIRGRHIILIIDYNVAV
jgi:uncharacterized protein with von Willebrand factor type A (vWA) domain